MEDKVRCQSCGMPLSTEADKFGTDAESSPVSEYCQFCYQDGAFTKPDQTVDEMVQTSVNFMTANLGFTEEDASRMSNDVIPKLKRWQ